MVIGISFFFFFSLKIGESGFGKKTKTILPKKNLTKRAAFFAKYCNKPAKKLRLLTDNIIKQDRKIVKVKYVLLSIWEKKRFKKGYFFLLARPLIPPPS